MATTSRLGMYVVSASEDPYWQDLRNSMVGDASTSNTQLIDAAIAALQDNKQNNITIDTLPTSDSANPVSSGGVFSALGEKAATSHTHPQSDVANLTETLGTKADLIGGVVPASQLPSYVDDVLEFQNLASFPATGESGKVYVAEDTNITYRWSGSGYVQIGSDLALGETSATAYRGDRGKAAYDHSQDTVVHVTSEQKTAWNGKQDALTFDAVPTDGSTNPVSSGGIFAALSGKSGKASGFDVTLPVSGWSSLAQTVDSTSFSVSGYAYVVAPSGSSYAGYVKAGCYLDDITLDGSGTFRCVKLPETALTAHIFKMEVEE